MYRTICNVANKPHQRNIEHLLYIEFNAITFQLKSTDCIYLSRALMLIKTN